MKEHAIINLDRTVNVPESMKKIGIQYDHNVKTITFDCPRYPDESQSVDMSSMKIFINWMLPDKTLGSTIATNVCVDSENENLMHFDWVITRVVTSVSGVLSTLICIKETTETGEETYHWNSELIQSFKVGNGMECTEEIVEQNIDVITQLLVQMDAVNTRTSEEALERHVENYLTENPPTFSDQQADESVRKYMEENAQTHVDDYLGRNPLTLDETLKDSSKAAPADVVGELKDDLGELTYTEKSMNLINLNDEEFELGKYLSNTGIWGSNSSYSVTGYIEVEPNTKYKISKNKPNYDGAGVSCRWLTAYDENKTLLPNDGSANGFAIAGFTTSANTKYVRITLYGDGKNTVFTKYENQAPYDEYYVKTYLKYEAIDSPTFESEIEKKISEIAISTKTKSISVSGNLTSGNTLSVSAPNVITNKHLSFNCNVSTMGELVIAHGTDTNSIHITDTELKIYYGSALWRTKEHGLTIGDNLQVKIDVDCKGNPKISLQSMGVRYDYTDWNWYGNNGDLRVYAQSGEYSNCILSWTCDGYTSDIQLYGDSYFSAIDGSRWTKHMLSDGYTKHLIDAFSGRTAIQAYTSFEENMKHSTPKMVVWCMGMNNKDSEVINPQWLEYTEKVIEYCERNNIELVLATIPNTTTQNNMFKNEYVRNSGYRYIDFAKSVNAENSGATWYSGMLHSDNVHPTELGAKTLYMRAIADVPELMIN